MTMRRLTLALSIALVICPCASFGADTSTERETLQGLKGFKVVIEELPPAAIADGLTVDQLRIDVELRLRKAGVPVTTTGRPFLYINVYPVKRKDDVYVYSCRVEVMQEVLVLENEKVSVAATWSDQMTGSVGSLKMARFIRDQVADLVDEFLNAYLSVNPK